MSERVPEKKQDLQWPVSEHDHLVEHTEGSEGDTLVVSCTDLCDGTPSDCQSKPRLGGEPQVTEDGDG